MSVNSTYIYNTHATTSTTTYSNFNTGGLVGAVGHPGLVGIPGYESNINSVIDDILGLIVDITFEDLQSMSNEERSFFANKLKREFKIKSIINGIDCK